MSIFLSPSSERNLCFLLDKSKIGNDDDSSMEEKIKVWVSEGYLAVVSPVFQAMLFGDYREAKDEGPIHLPGINDQDFLKFLDCLFPYPTQKEIDDSNVETVLRLSDLYQVGILLKKCDEFYDKEIRSRRIGDEKVLNFLPIIYKYKLNISLKTCVPYAAALDLGVLAAYRLKQGSLENGYAQFFSAIYEAKLRRTSLEEHPWSRLDSHRCRKCQKELPKSFSIDPDKCRAFHACSCKNNASSLLSLWLRIRCHVSDSISF